MGSQYPQAHKPLAFIAGCVVALVVLGIGGCGSSEPAFGSGERASDPPPAAGEKWFAAWTTAHTAENTTAYQNQTLRMVTHLTAGGDKVRVKFRNHFGVAPVTLDSATVGIRAQGAELNADSVRSLTFGGLPTVTIGAGQDVFSDPVSLSVAPFQDLAVSFFLQAASSTSQDADAYLTSYVTAAGAGNHASDPSGAAFTATTRAAVLVEEVAVHNNDLAGAIIAVGGSVVDGTGSTLDGHDRWTDWLAKRIGEEMHDGERLSVGNEGIGGNTTTNVMDRFDRDVLDKTGLTHVVLYAGTNDLTGPPPVGSTGAQIIENYRSLIARSHAAGKKIIISTITPRASYTAAGNQERKIANDWLRTGQNCSGECDGIVDFDSVTAWFGNPNMIDPTLDSGDTIHPNGEGYRRMANNFNLSVFTPAWPSSCSRF